MARFAGFETKTVANVTRDYLQLQFACSDKVYMPVEQLAKISRYLGAGSGSPTLSKLGGKTWETMKARARRAAQELAGELLNLYAERRKRAGTPFPRTPSGCASSRRSSPTPRPPTSVRRSRSSRPTWSVRSRWTARTCGDVGYGKTEVALRAAFKAADDGPGGAHPRSDDDPRRAALRQLRRAAEGESIRSPSTTSRASVRPRSRRRSSRRSTRAASTF